MGAQTPVTQAQSPVVSEDGGLGGVNEGDSNSGCGGRDGTPCRGGVGGIGWIRVGAWAGVPGDGVIRGREIGAWYRSPEWGHLEGRRQNAIEGGGGGPLKLGPVIFNWGSKPGDPFYSVI